MEPLFIDAYRFEKVANETALPEDPNSWPMEILQELHKQVPYIADFDPHIVMDRVDAERGFAFGHVEVGNKTGLGPTPKQELKDASGVREVKIPLIVVNRKLQPFDVIITANAKMIPLTENRLREALFRPSAFDITSKTPGDVSLISELYPPTRQYNRQGGTGVSVDMGKTSEDKAASRAWRRALDEGRVSAKELLERVPSSPGMPEKSMLEQMAHRSPVEKALQTRSHNTHVVGEALRTRGSEGASKLDRSVTQRGHGQLGSMPFDNEKGLAEYRSKKASVLQDILPTIRTDQYENFFSQLEDPSVQALFLKNASATAGALKVLAQYEPPSKEKMAYVFAASIQPTVVQLTHTDQGYRVKAASHLAWAPIEQIVDRGEAARRFGDKVVLAADLSGSVTITDQVKEAVDIGIGPAIAGVMGAHKAPDGQELAGAARGAGGYMLGDMAGSALGLLGGGALGAIPALTGKVSPEVARALIGAGAVLGATVGGVGGGVMGYKALTKKYEKPHKKEAEEKTAGPLDSIKRSVRNHALAAGVVGGTAAGAAVNASGRRKQAEAEGQSPEMDRPVIVSDFGLYKVKDVEGRDLIGFVFPNLIDVDGTSLPISLFTNGSQAAVQSEILGVKVSEGAALMEGHPRGHGVFYRVLPNGKAEATVPFTLHGSIGGENSTFSGESFTGQPVQISQQPMLQNVTAGADGQVLLPEDFRWMPLEDADDVALVTQQSEWGQKTASYNLGHAVLVRADGEGIFTLSGLPIEKVAEADKTFVDTDGALFLLGGLGVDLEEAQQKLGQALAFSSPVTVPVEREITLLGEQRAEAIKMASERLANFPSLSVSLVKEAANIPDPMAVDTVLSLGFLNPENMSTFVGYLPKLNETQEHLCELLIAARLGMRPVPVSPLEKSIKSLEQVIEGLKVIAFGEKTASAEGYFEKEALNAVTKRFMEAFKKGPSEARNFIHGLGPTVDNAGFTVGLGPLSTHEVGDVLHGRGRSPSHAFRTGLADAAARRDHAAIDAAVNSNAAARAQTNSAARDVLWQQEVNGVRPVGPRSVANTAEHELSNIPAVRPNPRSVQDTYGVGGEGAGWGTNYGRREGLLQPRIPTESDVTRAVPIPTPTVPYDATAARIRSRLAGG